MNEIILGISIFVCIIHKMKPGKLKTLSKLTAGILIAYCGYLAILWDSGWEHFKKGGGVFTHSPLDKDEMELALIKFRKHSIYSPLSTDSRNYSGESLIYLGRYKEAIKEFNESLSIRSTFTANYRRAYAYKMLKDYTRMVESLNQAAKHEVNFNSVARFRTEFADVKDHPLMKEFREQL